METIRISEAGVDIEVASQVPATQVGYLFPMPVFDGKTHADVLTGNREVSIEWHEGIMTLSCLDGHGLVTMTNRTAKSRNGILRLFRAEGGVDAQRVRLRVALSPSEI